MGLAQGHKAVTQVMFEPATPSVSSQTLTLGAVLLTFHQNKIYRTPEIGIFIYDNQHLGTIQTRPSQPVCMAGKAGILREKTLQAVIYFYFILLSIFLLLDNSIAYMFIHTAHAYAHILLHKIVGF